MEDEDGYFGERVAATYDGTTGIFEPGAVDAAVGVLAELAGGGRALELGIGDGTHRAAAGPPRRPGARHRPVAGDGGPAARQAGRGRDRRHHRGLRDGQ